MWGALAGVAGAAFDGLTSAWQNAQDRRTRQDNVNYNEYIRSTGHQFAVEDMRKAGLNPMLSGMNQTSASSGPNMGGAPANAPDVGDQLMKGVSSALEARRLKKDIEIADAEITKKNAEEDLAKDQALNLVNQRKTQDLEQAALKATLPATAAKAEAERRQAVVDAALTKTDAVLKRLGQGAAAVGNAAGAVGAARGRGIAIPNSAGSLKQMKENQRLREELKLYKSGRKGVPVN